MTVPRRRWRWMNKNRIFVRIYSPGIRIHRRIFHTYIPFINGRARFCQYWFGKCCAQSCSSINTTMEWRATRIPIPNSTNRKWELKKNNGKNSSTFDLCIVRQLDNKYVSRWIDACEYLRVDHHPWHIHYSDNVFVEYLAIIVACEWKRENKSKIKSFAIVWLPHLDWQHGCMALHAWRITRATKVEWKRQRKYMCSGICESDVSLIARTMCPAKCKVPWVLCTKPNY